MNEKINIQYIRERINTAYEAEEANAIARNLYEYLSRKNQLSDSLLEQVIRLLLEQTPLQYITGEAWFYHRCFEVNNAVLIPRPETEELVELVYKKLKNKPPENILDIGTGSGCIAITLKHLFPNASVTAIDKSKEALNIAKKNATALNAEVRFIETDFLDDAIFNWNEKFDLIISNPPYIPVSEKSDMEENVINFEPEMALFVPDNNALIFYEQIAKWSQKSLASSGMIFAEIHFRNGPVTRKLFEEFGYDVTLYQDISGNNRFISGTLTE